MYTYEGDDGRQVVMLSPGDVIEVEFPGGNGEILTIDADARSVTDEDGNDLTALAYGR